MKTNCLNHILSFTLIVPRYIWIWVDVQHKNKEILNTPVLKDRDMLVAGGKDSNLTKIHGKNLLSAVSCNKETVTRE
jgi:hypothetical protein